MTRDDTSSSEEEENRNFANNVPVIKHQKKKDSKNQLIKRKVKKENYSDIESDEKCHKSSYLRTRKKAEVSESHNSVAPPDNRRSVRTYSDTNKLSENGDMKDNKVDKDNSSKSLLNLCKSNADISLNNKQSSRFHCASQDTKQIGSNSEFNNEKSLNSNLSNTVVKLDTKSSNYTKTEGLSSKQHSLNLSNYSCRFTQAGNTTLPPRIAIYKSNVISNTSDASKWNTPFDSKRQKVHILYKSSDSLAPKRYIFPFFNFIKHYVLFSFFFILQHFIISLANSLKILLISIDLY